MFQMKVQLILKISQEFNPFIQLTKYFKYILPRVFYILNKKTYM